MSSLLPSNAERRELPHHNWQPRRKQSFTRFVFQELANFLFDTNWLHVAFKMCAFTYIIVMALFAWSISPFGSIWRQTSSLDHLQIVYQDFDDYFGRFEGFLKCGIRAQQLYQLPHRSIDDFVPQAPYCSNRAELLEAMSSGGRLGFEAPYISRDCYYRWYDVTEICMILERFDGIIFVGDSALQTIYSGLNILLRQDLSFGSLKLWEIEDSERENCMCDSQFVRESCRKHFVTSSDEVVRHVGGTRLNSYACQRTPHTILSVDSATAPISVVTEFEKRVPAAPPSSYKPIPIIHSLTLPNSGPLASASLTQFLNLADASKHKTPMLWIGPPASGHVEATGRKGNQEIWDFASEMDKFARSKDVEVLGMWNVTVQANSWDGLKFREKVAITQAMMVINWLSQLESY